MIGVDAEGRFRAAAIPCYCRISRPPKTLVCKSAEPTLQLRRQFTQLGVYGCFVYICTSRIDPRCSYAGDPTYNTTRIVAGVCRHICSLTELLYLLLPSCLAVRVLTYSMSRYALCILCICQRPVISSLRCSSDPDALACTMALAISKFGAPRRQVRWLRINL